MKRSVPTLILRCICFSKQLHEKLIQEKEGLENEVALLQREYESSIERHTGTMKGIPSD